MPNTQIESVALSVFYNTAYGWCWRTQTKVKAPGYSHVAWDSDILTSTEQLEELVNGADQIISEEDLAQARSYFSKST